MNDSILDPPVEKEFGPNSIRTVIKVLLSDQGNTLERRLRTFQLLRWLVQGGGQEGSLFTSSIIYLAAERQVGRAKSLNIDFSIDERAKEYIMGRSHLLYSAININMDVLQPAHRSGFIGDVQKMSRYVEVCRGMKENNVTPSLNKAATIMGSETLLKKTHLRYKEQKHFLHAACLVDINYIMLIDYDSDESLKKNKKGIYSAIKARDLIKNINEKCNKIDKMKSLLSISKSIIRQMDEDLAKILHPSWPDLEEFSLSKVDMDPKDLKAVKSSPRRSAGETRRARRKRQDSTSQES